MNYQEKTFITDTGDRPGELTLNTSVVNSAYYNLGTWWNGDRPDYVTVTPKFLHELANYIKENIPESDPLEEATFIRGFSNDEFGISVLFAKSKNGVWYSDSGIEYSETHLREDYTDFEVIV